MYTATFQSLTAAIYSTQVIENDVSARPPKTSASCDLDLRPPDTWVWLFMPLPGEDLCQFVLKSVHSFSKYSV